jgi:choline dehydrogenase-like flavoprotein
VSETQHLQALDASEPYDVCVIGSGPAGTTLGATLVRHGIRTVILESGKGLRDWFINAKIKKLAEYESAGDANYPVERTTSRLVGGNSNFWTGRCERFHPSDFEPHPYTPADNPWPITYAELEPYYAAAEETLRVRGGKPSRFMPPRTADFPLPSRTDIRRLQTIMARAEVELDHSPTATPAKAIRFFRVNREVLPSFLASPAGTLVSGATVTELEHDEQGRVSGAVVRTLDGATKRARARVYVVACGGIQTPRLLLLSRSERFPNGIGNQCDRVGRGFNEHPSLNIYARLRPSWSTAIPRYSLARTHQFYDRFKSEGLGAVHAVCIQSWIFPNHLLRYRLQDLHKHLWDSLTRLVWPTIYMSPTVEMLPSNDNRVSLSETRTDVFGNPIARLVLNFADQDRRLLERSRELVHSCFDKLGATNREEIEQTWSRHHIGTCRMGDNPKTSVVDRNLRVHDSPNLYLSGAETFVTGTGTQPVLTITALAHRLGEHLVGSFRQNDPSISGPS